MPKAPEVIDAPYQIICEGRDDMEFFTRLLKERGIDDYNVGCGRGLDGNPLGRDGFVSRIELVISLVDTRLKGIIIVADNDDNPNERFQFAVDQFKGRMQGLPIPIRPMESRESGNPLLPKTAVIMIPSAETEGALESLILSCCDGVTLHRDCVDAFCACVETPKRKVDADKLRLRAMIASINEADPSASISNMLSRGMRPFEMSHCALDEICKFLIDFKT